VSAGRSADTVVAAAAKIHAARGHPIKPKAELVVARNGGAVQDKICCAAAGGTRRAFG